MSLERIGSFGAELSRRKVWRVAVAYAAIGAAVIGVASDVVPAVSLPDSAVTVVVVLVLLGFPVTVLLSWTYDLTWGGVDRTEAPAEHQRTSVLSAELSDRSIVVLPFDNMSPDPGDAYFSHGLTDEIIANLSLLKDLRVISRNTAMVLKGTQKDMLSIGRDLGIGYVLEGSVRKAGAHSSSTPAPILTSGRNATTAHSPTSLVFRSGSPGSSWTRWRSSFRRRKDHAGHRSAAREILERNLSADRSDVFSMGSRLLMGALREDDDVIRTIGVDRFNTTWRRDPQGSYFMAGVHALAGRRDEALEDGEFCNHPFMVHHDALLRPLQDDPRFKRIATRAKERWLHFPAEEQVRRELSYSG